MTVLDLGRNLALVRIELDPQKIPDLLRKHAENYPDSRHVEAIGDDLVASGFDSQKSVQFVEAVYRWGKVHRNLSRVLKTDPVTIASALREGFRLADQGNFPEAVQAVEELPRMGLSFASKQLRFMLPEKAVILDSVLRERLGYRNDEAGYADLISDCQEMLRLVHARTPAVLYDGRPLRICDIEAAMFAKLQGY